jgi:thiol-disulfide isomerase/thioredoxin
MNTTLYFFRPSRFVSWRQICFLLMAVVFILAGCSNEQSVAKLTTLSGKTIDFADLKGHPVIINYWADWCGPCKKEIPALNEFAKTHPDVWLLGVNYDDVTVVKLQHLIQKNHIDYEALVEDPTVALRLGELPGIPATFVFDSHGRLVRKLFGAQTEKSLSKALS